jgi:hypothetical protein
VVGVVIAALWLAALLTAPAYPVRYASYAVVARSSEFLSLAFSLSLLSNFLVDLVAVWVALPSIDMGQNPIWWDLIRVTTLNPEKILAAKHAAAQVRAWRMMMVIVSVRVILVGLFVLTAIMFHWRLGLIETSPDMFGILPGLAILAATYVLEPYWRMRMMTALGLRIAARAPNLPMAILTGFGAILLVWILQMMIIFGLFFVLSFAMSFVLLLPSSGFVGLFVVCCVAAIAIYAFYDGMRVRSLKNATARLAQYEIGG